MAETAEALIVRYLEDAIAAERTFETQLRGFASEGDDETARQLFSEHADETRIQYQRLTGRLNQLGGSPSTAKSVLAHMFGMAPKTAQIGHDETERVTQNLIIAYAVESAEMAMYESLIACAARAGDAETERLAREIQQQERQTAEKVWREIPRAAARAFANLAGSDRVRKAG